MIPDALITLDWETYYSTREGYTFSNKKVTTESYVRDPRFEPIGIGVKINDGPSAWMEAEDFRRWAARVDWPRVACLAHHAHFDGLVLSHHFNVCPGFWLDTLSMGRGIHGTEVGGSLGKLARYYDVGEKGDEVIRADGKRRRDFAPPEWVTYGAYCKNDCELTYRIFQKMIANGFPENALREIDMTVRMFTEPSFLVDEAILTEFRDWEIARKRELLRGIAKEATGADPGDLPEDQLLALAKGTLASGDKFAALLVSLGVEPPLKVSAPKTKTTKKRAAEAGLDPDLVEDEYTYAFAKGDPGMQELLEHEDPVIRALAEARVAVKSTLNETRAERFLRAGAGNRRVPVYLKWHAAHAGRWGGGDKMNFQNLERVAKKKPRKGMLRKALLAPPGETLVVVDSGQIEARVVAWEAGDQELLEVFRRNDEKTLKATCEAEEGDFYADRGSAFFGMQLSKEKTPDERQIAKNMILGLGYGMGWRKFAMELIKGMMGADPVQFTEEHAEKYAVDVQEFAEHGFRGRPKNRETVEEMPSRLPLEARLVHCAVADYFVKLYREANQPIVGLWAGMKYVLEAMLDPAERPEDGENWPEWPIPFGPNDCIAVVRHGLLMPDGLVMKYPGLRASKSGYSYMGGKAGKERVKVYGGLLVENITQRLAKIIVAEQALEIQDAVRSRGGRIVTTTHDEVVPSLPDSQVIDFWLEAKRIMRKPLSWCMDLPLAVSGGKGKAYGLAK